MKTVSIAHLTFRLAIGRDEATNIIRLKRYDKQMQKLYRNRKM